MEFKKLYFFLIFVIAGFPQFTAYAENPSVEKVHIIFKTHLDIGFTQLSSEVEQRYIDLFIPKAVATAEELRDAGGKERYIWTTGSWLIRSFLENASPGQANMLEEAIRRGDIVWNGVPYTVESEVMTEEHFETVLKLSKQLDERFGKKTTAAKMTDVPGHTRSIVPLLSGAGIRFLHIGINPASAFPHVPAIFRWREQDGSEVIIMYQKDYGNDIVFPDGKTAMVVAFTGDNRGPHSPEQVRTIYASIQERYPNAELHASDLNTVAADLETARESLPVITSEIGDTWIHGYGSSPVRMARFRALSRLYTRWIGEKRIDPDSKEALDFAVTLGLIAEHTWGLDVKSFLKNWDKYEFDVFQQARELPEFQRVEASWQNLDSYIDRAVGCLPPALRAEAGQEIETIGNPATQVIKGKKVPGEITTGGALKISHKGTGMVAGELGYQSFSKDDFDRFQQNYMRLFVNWSISDFGKPGLENTNARSAFLKTSVKNCDYKTDKNRKEIACGLVFDNDGRVDSRVLPRKVYANYTVSPSQKNIELSVTLIDKAANRMPEAYWYSFRPENIAGILVEKVGRPVNVLDVVEGGNRQMHGIDKYVDIITDAGRIRITSLDAPLVAIGEPNLLNYSLEQPDINGGVHFCLFNNVWGTNFSMWFEGSITYRFKIEFLD